ncbi:hypothetical protein B4U80_13371 [Leptotrombidium deliense]|uniref:Cytochrome P450 2U1-like protein n=1 Tax=Leptotrombidium deliense TaxID=299467 RepID=A0A443S7F0_9ACAR|nr:hypothetical protein B4U80_13371 [Leptotrombidium deliense]
MGKSDFSWKIHDICDDLIGYLKEERVITNLPLYTTNFTSNVISTLLYGKKYHPNDPKFRELMKCVETIMGTGQDTYFYLTGPLFTILLKSQSKLWKNLLRSIDHIYDLMNERLKDRFESNERIVDENNDILDYILNDLRINNSPLFDSNQDIF